MGYGLVFAGGGVRGSYEMGVWRAINNMGIKIDGVTGVSIGSINAALFAQDEFDTAMKMWKAIKISDILCTDQLPNTNLFSMQNIVGIAKELYNNQGLDVSPLQRLLQRLVDEDKITNSEIDFGLSTYSLTDRKGVELFKQDIPKGMFCEYMMASACLPGFQSKKIGDKIFLDGGVNNNMPVSMLIEKGYKDIIAVDVGGIGIMKSYNDIGVNVINIRCDECMVGVMEFDTDHIRQNMRKGYFDCYKAFGRLYGNRYYFTTISYFHMRQRVSQSLIDGMEYAAEILGVERLASYKLNDFILGTLKVYNIEQTSYKPQIPTTQSVFEVVTKMQLDKKLLLIWLVEIIKKGEHDFINNKLVMSVLGNLFQAANSIIYFSNK